MKYQRFEDLPVWKVAVDIAAGVYSLTEDRYFAQPGDLRSQLRRAALSIPNNIAEGFERGSTAELIAFLYIARGSAGEVRSMLRFVAGTPNTGHLSTQVDGLISLSENCSRQIRGWADSLQNTDIKGQRHLDDDTRKAYERKQRARELDRRIADILHESNPGIFPDPNKLK